MLTVTIAPALLDLLMAADKFECTMAEVVQPLTDAAKKFLGVRYKDITKFQDEVLNLPLVGVEAILASDDLQVASEDAVYDFVLKWSRIQYPKIEERQEILATRLAQFIRFSYMTCGKLRKVMACNDFEHEFTQKLWSRFCKCKMSFNPNLYTPKCEACKKRYHSPNCINMTIDEAKQIANNFTCDRCLAPDNQGSASASATVDP
uniref:BACK domain-containing protein n=1 Tax=Tanacetum cinerariifolium TaxID=118510 RepID=A0A6L2MAT4_TANCI|nr:hypothetical protein [Tanacetum cinerariifolium]